MMDYNKAKKTSDWLKLNFVNVIYAKSEPEVVKACNCPGSAAAAAAQDQVDPCAPLSKAGGGDARVEEPHKKGECSIHTQSGSKASAGDRGKTGAGVTGSRSARFCSKEELPPSAKSPGLLRHIHNAARLRLPQCFEGATCSMKQSSSNNWVIGHSLAFSSVSPGGYRFLLSYCDRNKPSGVPYFVMEAAPGGQMSCEFRVGPTKWTRATVVAQIADAEFYSFESIFDAYFSNFTTSVIAVNKEFIAMHFLQAVTNNLSMGAEVVARAQMSELSSASAAARYATENQSLSATLGNRGVDLCYARAITPFLTTAALLEVGFAVKRSVATLAYEWRHDDWAVRGSADSDGLVGATLERNLGGQRAHLSCAISALLNHPNDKFRLGFNITAAII